ncbi:hypothetical protein [Ensifer sp. Root278]|uniref:hypothetical protein n=1 Tax=Ensifer sp. Root278 TaxID=1736509 RepID=UPI000B3107AB|nr:hypothetical protein [Ensifer sp. Root278]
MRFVKTSLKKSHNVSTGTLLGRLGLASPRQVGGRSLADFWLDEQFEDLAFEHRRDLRKAFL